MTNSFTKSASKLALTAAIALGAISVPAAAQVNGIATVRPAVVVARSLALQAGYQTISTTYATQFTQLEALNTQRVTLLRSIDTNGNGQAEELDANGDGNLDAAEQAASPVVTQVAALDQQIGVLEAPIQMAQLFVVNQIAQQYGAAAQAVIAERSVQVMLTPESVVYAADGLDISELVAANLNARLPSVSITPAPGWTPDETTIGLYQQVQQVFAVMARSAQAQAAQAAPATEGR